MFFLKFDSPLFVHYYISSTTHICDRTCILSIKINFRLLSLVALILSLSVCLLAYLSIMSQILQVSDLGAVSLIEE